MEVGDLLMKFRYSVFSTGTPIIGPESDHWQCLSLTHWLTHSVTFSWFDWCDPGRAQGLVKIMKLKLRRDFEAEVKSVFCCWSLVEVIKLFLVEILELRFVKILKLKFSQNADIWLKLLLGWDYDDELCSRFFWELVKWPKEVTLVTRTQPSGPLCLWQCLKT